MTIDYDKLEVAHQLAEKLSTHFIVHAVGGKYPNTCHEFTISCWDQDGDVRCKDIDDLLAKLQELTQPKAKYEKMLDMYWMFGGIIYTGKLDFVTRHENTFRYQIILDNGDYMNLDESQVYPTKSALIESQIEYWKNILTEELEQHVSPYCEPLKIEECYHERDETQAPKLSHFTAEEGCVFVVRCVKCQAWFREHHDACQHENDGCRYIDDVAQSKCLKCGEFYK